MWFIALFFTRHIAHRFSSYPKWHRQGAKCTAGDNEAADFTLRFVTQQTVQTANGQPEEKKRARTNELK